MSLQIIKREVPTNEDRAEALQLAQQIFEDSLFKDQVKGLPIPGLYVMEGLLEVLNGGELDAAGEYSIQIYQLILYLQKNPDIISFCSGWEEEGNGLISLLFRLYVFFSDLSREKTLWPPLYYFALLSEAAPNVSLIRKQYEEYMASRKSSDENLPSLHKLTV